MRVAHGAAHTHLRHRWVRQDLLAMEFLVRGATECDEPGVFMAFEETGIQLTDVYIDPSGKASVAWDKVAMGRSRQHDAVKSNGSPAYRNVTGGKRLS
jgi:hypothetical protein